MEQMSTSELAERYGIKPKSISNWVSAGHIKPVGKKGLQHSFDVLVVDQFWKSMHPAWELGTKKPKKKIKKQTVIQMPLNENLNNISTAGSNSWEQPKMPMHFTAEQVAALLKAMV